MKNDSRKPFENFDLDLTEKLKSKVNNQIRVPDANLEENSKISEAAAEEEFNYPEIVDPTKKITKSKAKKSKSKGKSFQIQNSKEKKEEVEVEWDFEDQSSDKIHQKKKNGLTKETVEEFIGNETKHLDNERLKDSEKANNKCKGLQIVRSFHVPNTNHP